MYNIDMKIKMVASGNRFDPNLTENFHFLMSFLISCFCATKISPEAALTTSACLKLAKRRFRSHRCALSHAQKKHVCSEYDPYPGTRVNAIDEVKSNDCNRKELSQVLPVKPVVRMPFANCPLCSKRYPEFFLATHASSCSPSMKRKRPRMAHGVSDFGLRVYRTSISNSGASSEVGAPGFHLFPTVFSDIEADILNHVQKTPPQWTDYRFRKVKNYGPPYNLRERRFLFESSAPPQIPIPVFVHELVLPRFQSIPILSKFVPNQLSVAEYAVPDGHILPHNDCENGKIHTAVVGVCLGARCTMTLILRARYSGLGKDVKRDVSLPPGAVYVMSGDALRVWEHAIFPRKTDNTRYSLTFRDVSPATAEALWSKAKSTTQNGPMVERAPSVPIHSHGPENRLHTVLGVENASKEANCKRRRFIQQKLS